MAFKIFFIYFISFLPINNYMFTGYIAVLQCMYTFHNECTLAFKIDQEWLL
jgi:hypothetical protein